jgi:hypothetical protein
MKTSTMPSAFQGPDLQPDWIGEDSRPQCRPALRVCDFFEFTRLFTRKSFVFSVDFRERKEVTSSHGCIGSRLRCRLKLRTSAALRP